MPLFAIHTLHHRARCDGCNALSPIHCGDDMQSARHAAVEALTDSGWTHVVPSRELERLHDWITREGAGHWWCPSCAEQRRAERSA
jgi:hypothetical protein